MSQKPGCAFCAASSQQSTQILFHHLRLALDHPYLRRVSFSNTPLRHARSQHATRETSMSNQNINKLSLKVISPKVNNFSLFNLGFKSTQIIIKTVQQLWVSSALVFEWKKWWKLTSYRALVAKIDPMYPTSFEYVSFVQQFSFCKHAQDWISYKTCLRMICLHCVCIMRSSFCRQTIVRPAAIASTHLHCFCFEFLAPHPV